MATMFWPCSPHYMAPALQLRKPHQANVILAYLRCIKRSNELVGRPRNHNYVQIRTPTFGFVQTVSLSLGHKTTRGSPKLLLSRIVKRLGSFYSPAKDDLPCSMQPFRQLTIAASSVAVGTIAQAPEGSYPATQE